MESSWQITVSASWYNKICSSKNNLTANDILPKKTKNQTQKCDGSWSTNVQNSFKLASSEGATCCHHYSELQGSPTQRYWSNEVHKHLLNFTFHKVEWCIWISLLFSTTSSTWIVFCICTWTAQSSRILSAQIHMCLRNFFFHTVLVAWAFSW